MTDIEDRPAGASKLGFEGRGIAALAVTNFDSTVDWYVKTLGCEVVLRPEGFGWAELSSPVSGLVFGLQAVEEAPASSGGATLMFEVEDYAAARSGLEAAGVTFEGEPLTIPGLVRMATFLDPAGNALKIYQDLS